MNQQDSGPCEEIDPIDAAIAVTGSGGLNAKFEELSSEVARSVQGKAPTAKQISGPESLFGQDLQKLTDAYNAAKLPGNTNPDRAFCIIAAIRRPDGKIVASVQESPYEARLRWQHEVSPKSFHSVIFGSRKNHQHVTAYDLSIGSGKAVSDPVFYGYLCAVADWRLKIVKKEDVLRPSILRVTEFNKKFSMYLACEPSWRLQLIRGNADYYSQGILPKLPVLTGHLWEIVISETTSGMRVVRSGSEGKS